MIKNSLFFLGGVVLTFSLINIYYQPRISQKNELVNQRLDSLAVEKSYLARNMMYNLTANKSDWASVSNVGFVAYYSGSACFSCLESLLSLLNSEYGLIGQTRVVVDNEYKVYNVEGYNDTFQMEVEIQIDSSKIIEDLSEVLLIKIKENEVLDIIEYRPEEEYLFKKYFSMMFLSRN